MNDEAIPLLRAPAAPASRHVLLKKKRHRSSASPLLFRGWLVVAGAFLVLLAGYGAAYSYAAVAGDIQAAFGASRTSVSMVYAICGCAAFTISAVSGPLADRIGPRPLAVTGMGLVAVGLLAAATAQTLIEIYFWYGLIIGLGIGFAYVPAIAAVQRWFLVGRGFASGLAAAGIGVGTALVPPAAWAAAALGDWRTAFAVAGVTVATVGIGGALLLANTPEQYGECCDGDSSTPAPPATAARSGLTEVLRSRSFWLHYTGTLLVSMPVSLPFAHLVQSAADAGVAQTEALALLSLLGIGSIVGRFALGALADEVGREITFLGSCMALVGLAALWAAANNHLTFVVFAVGFGAAYGGFVALLPAVTADRFGCRSVGGVIGVLYTGRGIALLVAAPVLALLSDWSSGYALPLGAMAIVGFSGTVLLALASRSSYTKSH